jgi:Family of unknown function (DUF6703)
VSSANPRRSGNRATGATTSSAAGPAANDLSPFRTAVNERSRPVLAALARLPRIIVSAGVLLLMVVGLVAPLVIALPAFAVIAAFVGWLAYLSWPALDTRGRLVRALLVALVLAAAALQIGESL